MPIIRSGYATTPRRNGSTRAWRQARAQVLALATHCGICHEEERDNDPFEVGHITPHAYGGSSTDFTNLEAQHRSCNRRQGTLSPQTTQGGGGQ